MACLDTTFLIDLLRGKQNLESIKNYLTRTGEFLSIPAPAIMEVWEGACLVDASREEKIRILELIDSFAVLPLDAQSAKEAGEISAELRKTGKIIQVEDIMIAGIAKVNGEKVVTRDEGYARICGLEVIKY